MIYTDFPNYFNQLAFEIGKARSIISGKIYKKGTEKHRGSKEEEISTRGVLGELIVRHFFDKHKTDSVFNPIIDLKPVVSWDCSTLLGNYDIKTVKMGDNYLRVNRKAHENDAKRSEITHYMFVILKGKTSAEICAYPTTDVDSWKIVKSRYTDIYIRKI